mmetsp:Transcript_29491/g.68349  ORF Transcript_29491/g.68349 Transcript_29491/m.68349 type:complete len:226 (+) Transcript_29491:213-890(+)
MVDFSMRHVEGDARVALNRIELRHPVHLVHVLPRLELGDGNNIRAMLIDVVMDTDGMRVDITPTWAFHVDGARRRVENAVQTLDVNRVYTPSQHDIRLCVIPDSSKRDKQQANRNFTTSSGNDLCFGRCKALGLANCTVVHGSDDTNRSVTPAVTVITQLVLRSAVAGLKLSTINAHRFVGDSADSIDSDSRMSHPPVNPGLDSPKHGVFIRCDSDDDHGHQSER